MLMQELQFVTFEMKRKLGQCFLLLDYCVLIFYSCETKKASERIILLHSQVPEITAEVRGNSEECSLEVRPILNQRTFATKPA